MNNENLATEILHEIKLQSKRYFIMLLIAIILLFVSNALWLIAWKYNKQVSSYNLRGHDNAQVLYNNSGEIDVNGENK